MEQCDCVLALLHAHKNPDVLHPTLWQFCSFVKTLSLIRNTIHSGFPASRTRS
jgi:hypothetical protein